VGLQDKAITRKSTTKTNLRCTANDLSGGGNTIARPDSSGVAKTSIKFQRMRSGLGRQMSEHSQSLMWWHSG